MKKTTTDIVLLFLDKGIYNKRQLSEDELGVSRPTLDSRLSGESEWKKLEIKWLNVLYDEYERIIRAEQGIFG